MPITNNGDVVPDDGPKLPFAVYDGSGTLVFLVMAPTELTAWCWFLGYPHKDEIADKKAAGFRCCWVDVLERRE